MTDIGPKRPTVKRTVFSTSRSGEFLELRALQAQTGQPVSEFGNVALKEELDNALDAAEAAGMSPVIEIATRTDGKVTFITVTDNGPGISTATVADICNFDMLVSDKARYRGPTRGAQGNAFKTLLGIPYALGVTDPVVIESRGGRHELRVTVDRVGSVGVDHDETVSDRTLGTSVTVPVPAHLEVDAWRWAYGAALVNPHATISVIDHGQSGDTDEVEDEIFYKSAGQAWSKWTPSKPSSPHWYDRAAFSGLAHSYIHKAEHTGVDVPLGKFISEFDGLSGSAKQKAVRAVVPGVTHLSGLDGRDDLIAALHDAMLDQAKPTQPKRLGPVGRDHYEQLLDGYDGVHRFWYNTTDLIVDGTPWVIEVAVADTASPGEIWFACNHSPSFDDPLGRIWLEAGNVTDMGVRSFLEGADIRPGSHHAVVVHIICAAPQFTDRGKVTLVAPESVADAAAKALHEASKVLRKEAELRRKDARKAELAQQRAREAAARAQRKNQMSVRDAVYAVLLEAKEAAGLVVAIRTLYYKVRPLVQKLTDKPLGYKYFSGKLVPEYERENGRLPGLYYEARGVLHHPHGGQVLRLGTREVKAYIPPSWQFDKVLYIEKEGLEAQLEAYRLGQKYDMAVIYGKGYAVEACRELLSLFSIQKITIFVLHDGDPYGYNIARTLAKETERMPNHNIEVIDLGLTVSQAIEAELETETFTRVNELPAKLDLDEVEEEWFRGKLIVGEDGRPVLDKKGRRQYECQRCELNAFSADGLAEFIEERLSIELARLGIAEKLVPPPDVVDQYVRTARDRELDDLVWDEIRQMVDIDAVKSGLVIDYPDLANVDEARIRDTFTDDPTRSWRSSAQQLVNDDINATDGLADALRAQLAEQLATPQDHEE